MARWSLAGRVAAAHGAVAVAAAAIASLATVWLHDALIGALAAVAVVLPLGLWLARSQTRPWARVLAAVRDGIESLRDRDLSVSISRTSDDELGGLVAAYNSLGGVLRRERFDIYQRELLLDTVFQTTPLAMVLTNVSGRIVYSNLAARQLLREGRRLEGVEFERLLDAAPAPLREALASGADTLFTMDVGGEAQVYHASQRDFRLNTHPHRLVLLKQLTRELAAQEVAVWKRVIRVIAHELNNSLAPISSLAHSGHLLADEPDAMRLHRVFATIAERATHLASFIDGYARFAKLPQPRLARIEWRQILERLEGAAPFRIEGTSPTRAASVDASQIEQVLINLLKNALESGSAPQEIVVRVREHTDGFVVEVSDRGGGFTEEVLRDALLPFFSTKPSGTGLGLTLCREIIEAHGGRLSLANRPGGGALVTLWFPDESQRAATAG